MSKKKMRLCAVTGKTFEEGASAAFGGEDAFPFGDPKFVKEDCYPTECVITYSHTEK